MAGYLAASARLVDRTFGARVVEGPVSSFANHVEGPKPTRSASRRAEKTRYEDRRPPRSARQVRTPGSGWSTNNTTTTSGTTNSDTSTNHKHHQHEPRNQLRHFFSRPIAPTIIPSFSRGEEPPPLTRSPSLDIWHANALVTSVTGQNGCQVP